MNSSLLKWGLQVVGHLTLLTVSSPFQDKKHDADAKLTPEEAEHKRIFEEKRKAHYNEFQAVQKMRDQHLSSEEDEEEDEDDAEFVDPVAARNAKLNAGIRAEPSDSQ